MVPTMPSLNRTPIRCDLISWRVPTSQCCAASRRIPNVSSRVWNSICPPLLLKLLRAANSKWNRAQSEGGYFPCFSSCHKWTTLVAADWRIWPFDRRSRCRSLRAVISWREELQPLFDRKKESSDSDAGSIIYSIDVVDGSSCVVVLMFVGVITRWSVVLNREESYLLHAGTAMFAALWSSVLAPTGIRKNRICWRCPNVSLYVHTWYEGSPQY